MKESIKGLQWLEQNQAFLSEIYHLTFLSEEKLIWYVTPLAAPNRRDRATQMAKCSSRNECRNLVHKLVPTFRGTYKTGQRRKTDGRLRAQLSIRVVPMKYQVPRKEGVETRFVLFAFLYEHLTGLTFCCSLLEHLANANDLVKITPKKWIAAFAREASVIMGSLPLKHQVGLPLWKLRVPRQESDDSELAATFTVRSPVESSQEEKQEANASYCLSLDELSVAREKQDKAIQFTSHNADYGWGNPRVRLAKEIEVSDLDSYPELDQFIDCPLPPSYYKENDSGDIERLPIKTTELKKYLGKWMTDHNNRAFAWMELQEQFNARKLWLEIIFKNYNWKSEEIKDRKKRRKTWSLEASGYHGDDFFPLD